MIVSYRWICELVGQEVDLDLLAERLTAAGLEVESLTHFEVPKGVVAAKVVSLRPHPTKGKLQLVTVDHGEGQQEVVCGAANVPQPGRFVLLAKLGAELPPAEPGGEPFVIAERPIGGVPSAGMLCSESELGIGAAGEGIFVFPDDCGLEPGTGLADALPVGDVAIEIGLTPNRPDCLGHIGVARDLAAMLKIPFTGLAAPAAPTWAEGVRAILPEGARLELQGGREVALEDVDATLGPLSVTIHDAERCPRYAAGVVTGVSVGPSPFWLRYRLHVLGHRSISNLVDATNLVMLESGHPIHGFDLETLVGRRIEVRTAKEGERITTLDDVERTLVADDLLICDGEGPVALAGVMGAANSEISDTTRHVAIECAYFDPRSVRRTSRRLGLHTDASHRFERGVDPNDALRVVARAAAWMAEVGGGIALVDAIDVYPTPTPGVSITLRQETLHGLLGTELPDEAPGDVLERLGCTVQRDGSDWNVKAPSWRPDLGREVDLIEEVIRVYGYEHVPTEVPRVRPSRGGSAERLGLERRLRESAVAAGYFEAVTLSFTSERALAAANVDTHAVELDNPLSEERAVMRTSLLPGLLEASVHALRRQVERVDLAQLGRTFHPSENAKSLPVERDVFAAIVAGRGRGEWVGGSRDVDAFDLKRGLAATLDPFGVELRWEPTTEPPTFLHPRRSAQLYVGDVALGWAGELHPDVRDAAGLDQRAAYAELSFDALVRVIQDAGTARAPRLPRFPSVSRDVALLLDREVPARTVARALKEGARGLAEDVELFDVYEGEHVPSGKRSLAFRVTYRDPEATLTDKKVDKAHTAAVQKATQTLDATVR